MLLFYYAIFDFISHRNNEKDKQIERPMRWIKKTELENRLQDGLEDREVCDSYILSGGVSTPPGKYILAAFINL